jgi:cupin 2 domain-containing protein
MMQETLSDYSIRVEQAVAWEDLDSDGHVSTCFQYIENACAALYRRIGESADGIAIAIDSSNFRFKSALGFGDVAVIGVRIDSIDEDKFSTACRIIRKSDGTLVAEAETILVCHDSQTQARVSIPDGLRTALEAVRFETKEAHGSPLDTATSLDRPELDAWQAHTANLYDTSPPGQGERFDTILSHRNLVIERIVSSAAIVSRRYVQIQDEWVLMVQGEAMLQVAGETILLSSGEHVFLPAGVPHTVERVSAGALWLAVHLYPESAVAPGNIAALRPIRGE